MEKITRIFNQAYELIFVVSKLLPSSVSSKPTVTFSHLNHYSLDILFCSSFTPLLLNYTGETKADVFFSRGCKIRKDAMRKEIAGVNLPPPSTTEPDPSPKEKLRYVIPVNGPRARPATSNTGGLLKVGSGSVIYTVFLSQWLMESCFPAL